MRKFWNWDPGGGAGTREGGRTMYLDGAIAEEGWTDDDVTPELFREELFAGSGPVTVWINSPGGDVIAASRIYAMLMDYPYDVTVKVDGLAASAASVVAMAGTAVLMAPTAMMMVHNPATVAMGDRSEMRRAIEMLDEVKESIINAYEIRTGLPRDRIARLMDAQTWMNARRAVELGFADGVLEDGRRAAEPLEFSDRAAEAGLWNRISRKAAGEGPARDTSGTGKDAGGREGPARGTPATAGTEGAGRKGRPVAELMERLALLGK